MKNSSKLFLQVSAALCLTLASASSIFAGPGPRACASGLSTSRVSICWGNTLYSCNQKNGIISPKLIRHCGRTQKICRQWSELHGDREIIKAACLRGV